MSPEEYSQRLNELYTFVNGELADYVLVAPGVELLEAIKKRVSTTGKNSSDSNIGDYSTDPLYAAPDKFVKKGSFQARGKNHFDGNTIGDRIIPAVRLRTTGIKKNPLNYSNYALVKPDYTPRKTMYLDKGYKQLRDIQSLRTDIVNFKYSGQLLNDYQLQKVAQAVLLGITTERSAKIFNGLTIRFGDFFKPTEKEKENYLRMSQYAINRLTVNTLQGYNVTAQIE